MKRFQKIYISILHLFLFIFLLLFSVFLPPIFQSLKDERDFQNHLSFFQKDWKKWAQKKEYLPAEINWKELNNNKKTKTPFFSPKLKKIDFYKFSINYLSSKKTFSLELLNKKNHKIEKTKKFAPLGLINKIEASKIISHLELLWAKEWIKQQKMTLLKHFDHLKNGDLANWESLPSAYSTEAGYQNIILVTDPFWDDFHLLLNLHLSQKNKKCFPLGHEWEISNVQLSFLEDSHQEIVDLAGASKNRILAIDEKIQTMIEQKKEALKRVWLLNQLGIFAQQTPYLNFATPEWSELAVNIPFSWPFQTPTNKGLTDYQLLIFYDGNEITLQIQSLPGTTSGNLYQYNVLENLAPVIRDQSLSQAIISHLEALWTTEWKAEQKLAIENFLIQQIAHSSRASLTKTSLLGLNDQYRINVIVPQEDPFPDFEFIFTIEAGWKQIAPEEKIWETEWEISSHKIEFDGVIHNLPEIENINSIEKRAELINNKIATLSAIKLAELRLQAFRNHLLSWLPNLNYLSEIPVNLDDWNSENSLEMNFASPVQNGLQTYKLKILYDGTAVIFEIWSIDNNKLWTSSEEENVDLSVVLNIDQALSNLIDNKLEQQWIKEWDIYQSMLLTEYLKTQINDIFGDLIKTEISNNNADYIINLRSTPSIRFADFEFVLQLSVGREEVTAPIWAWEIPWKIKAATIQFDGNDHSLARISSLANHGQQVALINQKITELTEIKLAELKLQAFQEKLTAWSATVDYLSTEQLDWQNWNINNPFKIPFSVPVNSGLGNYWLQVTYDGQIVAFDFLNENDVSLWSSTMTNNFNNIDLPNLIDENLKTTIVQKLEETWINDWVLFQKFLAEREIENNLNFQINSIQDGLQSAGEDYFQYQINLFIPQNEYDFEFNFLVSIKIEPYLTPTNINLKPWNQAWKISETTIHFDGQDYVITDMLASLSLVEQIAIINTEIQNMQNEKMAQLKLLSFQEKLAQWISQVDYLTVDNVDWSQWDINNFQLFNFATPLNKDLSDYHLKIAYDGQVAQFFVLDQENKIIWSSVEDYLINLDNANLINNDLKEAMINHLEKMWTIEWNEAQTKSFKKMLKKTKKMIGIETIVNEDNDVGALPNYLLSLHHEQSEYDFPFDFSVFVETKPISITEKAWESKWKFASATITFDGQEYSMNQISKSDKPKTQISKINKKIEKLIEQKLSWLKAEALRQKLIEWGVEVEYMSINDSDWSSWHNDYVVFVPISSPRQPLKDHQLKIIYSEDDDRLSFTLYGHRNKYLKNWIYLVDGQSWEDLKDALIAKSEAEWTIEWEKYQTIYFETIVDENLVYDTTPVVVGFANDGIGSFRVTMKLRQRNSQKLLKFQLQIEANLAAPLIENPKPWEKDWKILSSILSFENSYHQIRNIQDTELITEQFDLINQKIKTLTKKWFVHEPTVDKQIQRIKHSLNNSHLHPAYRNADFRIDELTDFEVRDNLGTFNQNRHTHLLVIDFIAEFDNFEFADASINHKAYFYLSSWTDFEQPTIVRVKYLFLGRVGSVVVGHVKTITPDADGLHYYIKNILEQERTNS